MAARSRAHWKALFEPRGVVVAGASTHPGKFGFVALHNIIACGYQGAVYATNRSGEEVLGVKTKTDLRDVPAGSADLLVVCTPAQANQSLLRDAAEIGIKAAFVTSAGYGESGDEGRREQEALAALADELDIIMVGPNGQGLVSTSSSLCAQIVAPYPPPGGIGIASQSGNFVSSFMNYAIHYGVGVSRAVSAGNAASVGVIDLLEFYADDSETDVALAYVEGVADGRDWFDRLREVARRIPVVIVKGGATAGGSRAAASHTGSMAGDDRVFSGACAQAGVVRADNIEQAYEIAATFASQPLPAGPRVAVLTTAGGWGVLTADALSRSSLELAELPRDLSELLDSKLPPRWSRGNPIDLAGGETRDTIPEVMEAIVGHSEIDAVVVLGMGIQSNQGRLEIEGPFYPEHGLERIADFHSRQDARYATAAAQLAREFGKPVLLATELALSDRDNAAVAATRGEGKLAYISADRAVTSLDALWWRSRYLRSRELDQ